MIFTETGLTGAFWIDLEPHRDERGFFARSWCQQEFEERGLIARMVQSNISFNKNRGTLRGLHFQIAPYEEARLVRCTRGAIYDVFLDLRPGSATLRRWLSVELTAENYRALFLPKGFAHGFQTLTDDTEVLYLMSEFYHPEAARGVRWNDPAFHIQWPLEVRILSEQDASYPDWSGA